MQKQNNHSSRACALCGKPFSPSRHAKKYCPDCRAGGQREMYAAHARAQKAAKSRICRHCGKPFVPDRHAKKYCPDCRTEDKKGMNALYARERQRTLRDAGICIGCGKRTEARHALCADCRGRANARAKEVLAANRPPRACRYCGKDITRTTHGNAKYCPECRAPAGKARRDRVYLQKRTAGLCPGCGRPAAQGHTYCASCIARIKRYHFAKKAD